MYSEGKTIGRQHFTTNHHTKNIFTITNQNQYFSNNDNQNQSCRRLSKCRQSKSYKNLKVQQSNYITEQLSVSKISFMENLPYIKNESYINEIQSNYNVEPFRNAHRKQIQQLKQHIKNLQNELIIKDSALRNKELQFEEGRQKINSFQFKSTFSSHNEIKTSKHQKEQYLQKIFQMQNKYQQLAARNNQLEKQLRKKNSESKIESSYNTSSIKYKQQLLEFKQKTIEHMKKQMHVIQRNLNDKSTQLTEISNNFHEFKIQSEKQIKFLEGQLRERSPTKSLDKKFVYQNQKLKKEISSKNQMIRYLEFKCQKGEKYDTFKSDLYQRFQLNSDKNYHYQQQMEKLKQSVRKYQQEIKQLKLFQSRNIDSASRRMNESPNKNFLLKAQIQNQKLREENLQLKQQLLNRQDSGHKFKDIKLYKIHKQQLIQKIKTLENINGNYVKQVDNLLNEIEMTNNDNVLLKEKYDNLLKINEQFATSLEKYKYKHEQNNKSDLEIKMLKNQIATLKDKNNSLKVLLEQEQTNSKKQHSSQTISSLKEKILELDQKYNQTAQILLQERQENKQKISNLEKLVTQKKLNQDALTCKVLNLTAELQNLCNKLQSSRKLQNQKLKFKEQQTQRLKTQNQTLQQKVIQQQLKIKELQVQNKQYDKKLLSIDTEIRRIKQQQYDVIQSMKNSHIIQNTMNQLTKQLEYKTGKFNLLVKQNNQIKQELLLLKNVIKFQKEKNQDPQKQQLQLIQQLNRLNQTNLHCEKQLIKMKSMTQNLIIEKDQLRTILSNHQTDNQNNQKQNQLLKQQIEKKTKKQEQLQIELRQLKQFSKQINFYNSQLQQQLLNTKIQLKRMIQSNEELTQNYALLYDEKIQLKEQISSKNVPSEVQKEPHQTMRSNTPLCQRKKQILDQIQNILRKVKEQYKIVQKHAHVEKQINKLLQLFPQIVATLQYQPSEYEQYEEVLELFGVDHQIEDHHNILIAQINHFRQSIKMLVEKVNQFQQRYKSAMKQNNHLGKSNNNLNKEIDDLEDTNERLEELIEQLNKEIISKDLTSWNRFYSIKGKQQANSSFQQLYKKYATIN